MATTGDHQKAGAKHDPKSARSTADKAAAVIKKYANRRLYNTESSSYVTLDDLAAMIKAEQNFVVVDAKTGEDLTRSVLTQIILEEEGRGQNLLPVSFLRQLIRFYGDSFGVYVPSFLELSMASLAMEQEKLRDKMTDSLAKSAFPAGPFGPAALEAMQEQARRNADMFQKAMAMFSPFGGFAAGPNEQDAEPAKKEAPAKSPDPKPAGKTSSAAASPAAGENELALLRRQMQLMQQQLDRLASGKG